MYYVLISKITLSLMMMILSYLTSSLSHTLQGGSARQVACELMNLIKIDSSFKVTKSLVFCLLVASQLILQYVYMLDIVIILLLT